MTAAPATGKTNSVRVPTALTLLALFAGPVACGNEGAAPVARSAASPAAPSKVGYDIRRLRPRNEERLAEMFERMRGAALKEGKVVAVLLSADWCEPCRTLDLELGNMHPADQIGRVRILEIKEEDWERATRMNEVNALRTRWTPTKNAYPILVLLDEKGDKIEEMQEAKERLEHAGREPTLPNWFSGVG